MKVLFKQSIHDLDWCKVGQRTADFPLEQIQPFVELLLHQFHVHCHWIHFFLGTLQSPTSDHQEKRTNTFKPVGYGLPGTNCLTRKRPVNGMICSSIQSFAGFGRLRQPYLTLSRSGLTFHRMSFFSVSSLTSKSLTIFRDFNNFIYYWYFCFIDPKHLYSGIAKTGPVEWFAKEHIYFFWCCIQRHSFDLKLPLISKSGQIIKNLVVNVLVKYWIGLQYARVEGSFLYSGDLGSTGVYLLWENIEQFC